ncbi:MAG: DUF2799 domain-containing protein [Betaproteobacteria bacterium]
MRALLLPVIALTLAACASMHAGECRSASWYDLGFRDGLFGLQNQSDIYATQCNTHGATVDMPRYAEGWRHGYWELEARRSASGHD